MKQLALTCKRKPRSILDSETTGFKRRPSKMTARQVARLALLAFGLLAVCNQLQPAQARTLFPKLAPGVEFISELTGGFVDTISGAMERGYEAFRSQIAATGGAESVVDECLDEIKCLSGAEKDPDAKRNVIEIIRSRGFEAEEHQVVTKDGYILTIQRIINPLIEDRSKLKPVLLQHGLMSSSVDWVINSIDIKPTKYPADHAALNELDENDSKSGNSIEAHQLGGANGASQLTGDSQEHPNSLGFYLANQGYDVFLCNSRGNFYGQKHIKLSNWNPKFWDFTFDEQIKYDLPDTIEFIQRLTKQTKVAYVGHSQGTTMVFGLLADRPEFADIIEPVVALAPVAYVSQCKSPVRHFAIYTPLFQHLNMWFASSNAVVRYLAPIVCGPKVVRRDICANIIFLSTGFDEAEFNQTRVSAYLAHMPSGTSVKNIAHWGQMVNSGHFAHFDHGILGNQMAYRSNEAPDYDLGRIRSKSISLFTAENDWLASPGDVARLKASLEVPLYKVVNVTEDKPKWNHIDFVYANDAGQLINRRIVEIFSHFRDQINR